MKISEDSVKTYCGYVAIVGRPNVGKSTLLNHLLKQKISITSRKPQTTRHRILGIETEGQHQCVFVDTPGFNSGENKALNRIMNETVLSVIADVDLVLFVVDRLNFNSGDAQVLNLLKKSKVPIILAINKTDLVKTKNDFFPHIQRLSSLFQFAEIVPISASTGYNLDLITRLTTNFHPETPILVTTYKINDLRSKFLA